MYGCEPYIQFSTLELFCIVAFAAAKAFFPSPATTGIAGGFSIRQKNGSSDELPFDLVPNDFFMFPLCYLLCRASRARCACHSHARGSRGTSDACRTRGTGRASRTRCARNARCACHSHARCTSGTSNTRGTGRARCARCACRTRCPYGSCRAGNIWEHFLTNILRTVSVRCLSSVEIAVRRIFYADIA